MTESLTIFDIEPLQDIADVLKLQAMLETTIVDPATKLPITDQIKQQLAEIRAAASDEATPHYIAKVAGKPVGVMGFRPFVTTDIYPNGWGKPAELVHAHVSAKYQGNGIGRALLNHVASIATEDYDELAAPAGRWMRWGKEGFLIRTFDRYSFQENSEDINGGHGVWRKRLRRL